jgi:hypothetical protein
VASPCAPDNQARGAFVDPASKSIQIANKTPYRTPASPLPPKSGTSDTEQHPCLQIATRPPAVAARAASPPIPSTQQRQSAGNSQINKPINDVTRQDGKRLDGSESKRERETEREKTMKHGKSTRQTAHKESRDIRMCTRTHPTAWLAAGSVAAKQIVQLLELNVLWASQIRPRPVAVVDFEFYLVGLEHGRRRHGDAEGRRLERWAAEAEIEA